MIPKVAGVLVSFGCYNRLSQTLSSNSIDLFSHSSEGQVENQVHCKVRVPAGLEGRAALPQSPPCDPGLRHP